MFKFVSMKNSSCGLITLREKILDCQPKKTINPTPNQLEKFLKKLENIKGVIEINGLNEKGSGERPKLQVIVSKKYCNEIKKLEEILNNQEYFRVWEFNLTP
jgi:hypothetical protein